MTEYFEVTRRDAAARLGKLLLKETHPTPLILKSEADKPIIYAGSLWSRKILSPLDAPDGKLVILPHKSMPLHTRPEMVRQTTDSIREDLQAWEEWKGPKGRIVHPAFPEISDADLYAIGAAVQLEHNPHLLFKTITRIRNLTPPDTTLYAPALATPENLALLIYLGIDVVDDVLPTIRAFDDAYLMPDGTYRLSALFQLPCRCSVCDNTSAEALKNMDMRTRGELIAQHNSNKLEEEKRVAIQHIRDGSLREYVEGKCRSNPRLTVLLRLADQEHTYLEQRTPAFRTNMMYANTAESLSRVEISRFARRVKSRFRAQDTDILLLLPCSARKPYSISNSHQLFARALGKNRRALNEVIISSPLGVVPRELELVYPAAHYDTPVTGHWDLEERSWVTGCLVDYLNNAKYSHIVAHLDGAYRDICRSAAETLGLEITYTAGEGGVTSAPALKRLGDTVNDLVLTEGCRLRKPLEITLSMMRAVADYQFGRGAGDLLAPENAAIRAPYPKHQVFDGDDQLASLYPGTGALIPTLEGADRLSDLGTYQVFIADFVPGSTLLAPGVVNADPGIRPSDQVIIRGPQVLGVGKALMSGPEMVQSTRGVAVEVRKIRKV